MQFQVRLAGTYVTAAIPSYFAIELLVVFEDGDIHSVKSGDLDYLICHILRESRRKRQRKQHSHPTSLLKSLKDTKIQDSNLPFSSFDSVPSLHNSMLASTT